MHIHYSLNLHSPSFQRLRHLPNGYSFYGHAISGDGRFVAFGSEASNLVFGDTNGHADIFLHDLEGEEYLIYLPLVLK